MAKGCQALELSRWRLSIQSGRRDSLVQEKTPMPFSRKMPAVGLAALTLFLSTGLASAQSDSSTPPPPPAETHSDDGFTQNEIVQAGANFFGTTTEAMAKAVQKVFSDNGLPDAYIKGDEGSGAVIVGLRYGQGYLIRKNADPVKVYWQGPSIGWDLGGNASKMFVLIYNLGDSERLYQKFPGVDGSFYVVAGLGVNYMRAGVNAGYITFTHDSTINPF
jgi:hypothetical protein